MIQPGAASMTKHLYVPGLWDIGVNYMKSTFLKFTAAVKLVCVPLMKADAECFGFLTVFMNLVM